MDKIYILQFFAVISVAIIMMILSIQNMKTNRFSSIVIIIIIGLATLLSIFTFGEFYSQDHGLLPHATVFGMLGYMFRPIALYMFILLERNKFHKFEKILIIPLIVNCLIYLSSIMFFSETLSHLSFYYAFDDSGALVYNRGPLSFSTHILGGLYLAYLLFDTIHSLRGKHRYDSLSILICGLFTVAAVIVEAFDLSIGVLNVTIANSCVFFYLFVLREESRHDSLTGLFDRKTYYGDLKKFKNDICGIIQIDMNGLKLINDTKGHNDGDKALKKIAECIESSCPNNLYAFRVGGDEFTVLATGVNKETLDKITHVIKKKVEENGLSCSTGNYHIDEGKIEIAEMLKKAEERMYSDKKSFYDNHQELERRKI